MPFPRGLFSRRAMRMLLWALGIFLAAAGINLLGIGIVGDVNGWSQWLESHSLYFLAWRMGLYGATAWSWWWMRRRVLDREPSAETRARLRRTEIAAVLTILALEVAVQLQ